MTTSRTSARDGIEKLVRYFEQNIHQLKASSFNEAQARQLLIDPFFEALGWDIRNKAMLPPFRLEVLPEGRVRTSVGRVVKEQTTMFPAGAGVKEEMQEYSSMLEYIADDEYKAEHKMASKKPDYRFRIQGSTKFFVEAKKPSVDLTNPDSVFQIKRYGFSARVPVSILTDFEEFRFFDCTRRPFHDKPRVGALKEFDLTYKRYLDTFDLLHDTFSREAVVGGSIEALQKKYLEKKKGEFALDRSFLDDLSAWRVELAQDIAKHPKNRRILNTGTLNESVQRILDRIVFLRVCEDRNIEVERTLLELMRVWEDHPGISIYQKFVELIKARRSLYNGLLFAEHESEQLEVSNRILEKIFKNINYPLSPYNFDEIGVEILGSIYERFLGKTIRLTQKQVRVEEKPEVRKAGGVYYTPQYIVNYIVENTVGKLLYDLTPSSGHPRQTEGGLASSVGRGDGGEVGRMKLTPKQVSKLKIIDIACGSGSFLLGAFQKLIDYHVQWYTDHPDAIKEVHGVRDAYEDAQGRMTLSARKKREILVNNIYGVDIDPQAVEVTQMSLYLKVLEDENDATLNKPTMLALHEVLLPPLKNNIKCGNSLIGTDISSQGDLFDPDVTRKINPFDWEVEFKEIMDAGGFDCVIGNPPYGMLQPHNTESLILEYLREHYRSADFKVDTFQLFTERAIRTICNQGYLGYIIPSQILTNVYSKSLRDILFAETSIINLSISLKQVFEDADVHTCVLIAQKEANKARKQSNVASIAIGADQSHFLGLPTRETRVHRLTQANLGLGDGASWNVNLDDSTSALITKINSISKPLSVFAAINRGLITGNRDKYFSRKKLNKKYLPIITGTDVNRYIVHEPTEYVLFEKPKGAGGSWDEEVHLANHKIVIRQIGKHPTASLVVGPLCVTGNIFTLRSGNINTDKFLLGVLNSGIVKHIWQLLYSDFKTSFPELKSKYLEQLPIRVFGSSNLEETQTHADIVAMVDKILDLHKQLQKSGFESEREPIQRQIEATDRKIDELVYALYELTEEEIRVVEGK